MWQMWLYLIPVAIGLLPWVIGGELEIKHRIMVTVICLVFAGIVFAFPRWIKNRVQKKHIIMVAVICLVFVGIVFVFSRYMDSRVQNAYHTGFNDGVESNSSESELNDIAEGIPSIIYTEKDLRDRIESNEAVIEIPADIHLSRSLRIYSGKNIELTSTDTETFSLIAMGDFDAVVVESGATLTINNIMITRIGGTSGRGIDNDGTTIMNGGQISGHMNILTIDNGYGGGVINRTNANFTMNNGIISHNVAEYGGGICNHGSLTIMDGLIYHNSGTTDGGGVYTSRNALLTMDGGLISKNTVSHGFGGGIFISGGAFEMEGGNISSNITKGNLIRYGYGGGVYINPNGSFVMKNGRIYNNEARLGGGVSNNGSFTMYNGKFTDNTARGDENSSSDLYNHTTDVIYENKGGIIQNIRTQQSTE
ncbi:MAG: hypothetical protein FWE27_07300 [Defluviitaleaceae bacterium]|nr:hypothetical protein [Defluviitaleaceae bacterium]